MHKDDKNVMGPYISMGVQFVSGPAEDSIGDCPFCGKEDHFFIREENGLFSCKHCGMEGNGITFMGAYSEKMHQETTPKDWSKLSYLRGLPPIAFQQYGMGFNPIKNEWLIPIRSEKGTVRDIRRWDFSKVMSSLGCHIQLFGMQELAKAPRGSQVWLCEGEWDGMALRWLLNKAGRPDEVVVAVPGSHSFKNEWVNYFRGMKVRACYDNDDAGDQGALKCKIRLMTVASKLEFLHWPETREPGFDIRDAVSSGIGKKITAKEAVMVLEDLMHPKPRHENPKGIPSKLLPKGLPPEKKPKPPKHTKTFAEVVEVFKRWVKLDQELHDALALSLAVCLANDVPGDPLWLQIVAPPGAGKTLVLLALQRSERVVFKSTLTPASLVSGFNVNPDPSLLPQLNGKCAVFKDGTELLSLNRDARAAIYGILRGAFDGYVNKPFGNGISRDYTLHFNMLMGITPAVYADNNASMGERFLRFEMREDRATTEQKIRAAIENIAREVKMEQALGDVCNEFLTQKINLEKLPRIPPEFTDRIVALSQVTSMLRAQVDRHQFGDQDVKYRPSFESGTRLAKQMSKLAVILCIVHDVPEVNEEIYRLIGRVAHSTTIGFHLDIMRQLMKPSNENGMSREQIGNAIKLNAGSVLKRLYDLEQLSVVRKYKQDAATYKGKGTSPFLWRATSEISKLWHRSFPNTSALQRFSAARANRPSA